ncbi:hypothetical protein [Streptomyces sp. NPDC001348]
MEERRERLRAVTTRPLLRLLLDVHVLAVVGVFALCPRRRLWRRATRDGGLR